MPIPEDVIVRDLEEIEAVVHSTFDQMLTRFPGLTYEDGIVRLWEWLTGQSDDAPFPTRDNDPKLL